MPSAIEQKLIRDAARSVDGLLTLLHEGLNWPVPGHLETIPLLEWSPEELHLRSDELGRLTTIKQVPKLTATQPFGVFILTFEGGRLPIGALRRVVNQLVLKKRARRDAASSQWDLGDLLFFCQSDAGRGSLHIVALRDHGEAPEIRTISWSSDPTPTRLHLLSEHSLPDLVWPDDTAVGPWRTTWRGAFTGTYRQGVKSAAQLSQRMAEVAQDIRSEITDLLLVETEDGPLHAMLTDMRARLDGSMDAAKFADMFAQTLVYGLLTSRISDPEQFDAADGRALLDFENPFLDAIYQQFRAQADDSLDLDQLGLTDLAHTLAATDMDALLADFGTKERKDDPVIYLYEEFLDRYDRDQRKRLGAYYTPLPVVSLMTRLVDDLLINDFGFAEGLADRTTWRQWAERTGVQPPVGVDPDAAVLRMIDPATGTGTFLLEWLRALKRRPGTDLAEQLSRMSALELSLASYAVAHLKTGLELPGALRAEQRLPILLADTLAGTRPDYLTGLEDPLAVETALAEQEKFHTHHTVVIGNPPYQRLEKAAGGGMITSPAGKGRSLFDDLLDPARENTIFSHHASLYNLYVYFWRWGIWKAFEQTTHGPAIVAFITASSWLDGPGFLGLRQLTREMADDIWIIDLGGDNKGAITDENIFGIETPVAITVLARRDRSDRNTSARVRYTRVDGTRSEKLAALESLDRASGSWEEPEVGWFTPMRPRSGGADWYAHPALVDLIPWQQPGCKFGRTWPIAPHREILRRRWARFMSSADPADRAKCFVTAKTGRNTTTRVADMPRLVDEPVDADHRPITGYGYRSFDRQFAFADPRLAKTDSPSLWSSATGIQTFLVSKTTAAIQGGTAASCSVGVPDLDNFRGAEGGKDIFPLYRDLAGTPNSDPAARTAIGQAHRDEVPTAADPSHEDLFAYCYGVLAGTDYTDRFHEELATPGPRVPLTAEPALFAEMAAHGRHLLWLHTFGERFRDGDHTDLAVDHAVRWDPEPSRIPTDTKDFRYDQSTRAIHVADGVLRGVAPEVWGFEVSGMPVLKKWLGYRTAKGTGRAANSTSPLDRIRPDRWYPEWSRELREVVHVLTESLTLMDEGADLLTRILDGPLITADQLPEPPKHLREVPKGTPGASGPETLPGT